MWGKSAGAGAKAALSRVVGVKSHSQGLAGSRTVKSWRWRRTASTARVSSAGLQSRRVEGWAAVEVEVEAEVEVDEVRTTEKAW